MHGDAHLNNIFVRIVKEGEVEPEWSGAKLRFIDMDWSGEAGVDHYTFSPNRDMGPVVVRLPAVQCGAVMQQQLSDGQRHLSGMLQQGIPAVRPTRHGVTLV